jgi:hypothetical protein
MTWGHQANAAASFHDKVCQLRERERQTRVRRIRRKHIKVTRLGHARHQLHLVVGHQFFNIGEPVSQKQARWFGLQLAIALERFQQGSQS